MIKGLGPNRERVIRVDYADNAVCYVWSAFYAVDVSSLRKIILVTKTRASINFQIQEVQTSYP